MSKRTITNYNLDFKQSAVKLALESDKSISQIAEELGVKSTTLHGWIKKHAPNKNAFSHENTALHEELKRLKKENLRLKQERDILKKAAAYFASETQ